MTWPERHGQRSRFKDHPSRKTSQTLTESTPRQRGLSIARALEPATAPGSLEFLWNVNLEGADLMGAQLVRTSFWGANLSGADVSYADCSGADFQRADLTGTSLYRTNVTSARFDDSLMDERTDIPGRRVTGLVRVNS